MPTDGPPLPDPKARTLARGPRKYRRKVASPKQWQAIASEKKGPCRVCGASASNGRVYGLIQLHHVVARAHSGDDAADNIVPLCPDCHDRVTRRANIFNGERHVPAAEVLLAALSDAEYAYMVQRGGEGYPERAYGVRYER